MRRYGRFGKILTAPDGTQYRSGLPFVEFRYDGGLVWVRVEKEGRMDLLAYALKSMGESRLWPLIGWLNGKKDPLTEVQVGDQIALPGEIVNVVRSIRGFTFI